MAKIFAILASAFAALGAAPAAPTMTQAPASSPVAVVKTSEPLEAKKLQFDVDVPASAADVWAALTTSEGLRTWIAPDARVDLRQGGDWLALFPGAAPGGGRIERITAPTDLVLHAMAPEKFPEVRSVGTTAIFALSPCGDRCTHVRLTQTGWRTGKEWDDAFDYLASGNAQLLELLHRRFVSGPIDWKR